MPLYSAPRRNLWDSFDHESILSFHAWASIHSEVRRRGESRSLKGGAEPAQGLSERFQIRGKAFVEQRAGSPLAQSLDDNGAGHAEFVEDHAGHQSGPIEAHSAMRQDVVSRPDDSSA